MNIKQNQKRQDSVCVVKYAGTPGSSYFQSSDLSLIEENADIWSEPPPPISFKVT